MTRATSGNICEILWIDFLDRMNPTAKSRVKAVATVGEEEKSGVPPIQLPLLTTS